MAKRRVDPDLEGLIEALGVKPKTKDLYARSIIHRSVLNESGGDLASNEKLEFLGDSILGAVVSEYLYTELPDLSEGQLARRKSALVSEASLATWAAHLELGKYLILGKGEEQTGGPRKSRPPRRCLTEAVLGTPSSWTWAGKEACDFVVRSLKAIPLSRIVQKTQDAKKAAFKNTLNASTKSRPNTSSSRPRARTTRRNSKSKS